MGDKIAMLKVWLALEVRQFISLSVQDVSKFRFTIEATNTADIQTGQVRWTVSELLMLLEAIRYDITRGNTRYDHTLQLDTGYAGDEGT